MRRRPAGFVGAVQPVASLMAWIYVYLVSLLGLWIVLVMVATGWRPIVVTSGSMAPTLRPGDVLLVDDPSGELVGQRSVITFDDPRRGELVTHRVFEVLAEDRSYITKGDANPSPDTDRVAADDVVGIGRLVVPLIGLPVVWAAEGQLASVAATGVLSVAAVGMAISGSRAARRRRSWSRSVGVADRAIRRVRLLVGLMIVTQFAIVDGRFDVAAFGLARYQVVVIAIVGLAAINAGSVFGHRRFGVDQSRRVSIAELVGDTALVVFLTTATGGEGVGWVLIALPIVEAAVRFRLAGALVQWMGMAALAVSTRLWVLDADETPLTVMVEELERVLDQLAVLLLVVIPGAYLAEQLVTDVAAQRRATDDAVERGRMLEHVAQLGNEVNRLGSEVFSTLAEAAVPLGFDVVDVSVRLPDGAWQVLSTARSDRGAAAVGGEALLPTPGEVGSALTEADLLDSEVVIDSNDPELAHFLPLAAMQLSSLIRINVVRSDETLIALRAAEVGGSLRRPGAVDSLRLLCAQATVALQNKELLGELRAVHSELVYQARHDPLTGLPNRAHFVDLLRGRLASATDPGRSTAVLFLDLNGFKVVNDERGHDVGDQLLRIVGQRLEAAVDADGEVARLGGDEFTVLIDSHDAETPSRVAARIHDALAEPVRLGPEGADVGVSVGVAFAEPGITESELLRRADAAMYAAKGGGGERRTALYTPELDEADRRRGRLAAEFRKSLDSGELELAYQPIVDATTDTIVGVEALLRWTHRELGPISTATVLELADVSGRVDDLNRWILTSAFSDLARWALPPDVRFTLAVNVSPSELASEHLIANLRGAFDATGIGPERVIIELSERIVTSSDGAIDRIDDLTGLGVGLALDDFGVGQTSLAHLRHLPIDQLKLDRVLVQQAGSSDADQIILGSIVALAHDLGFEVVAEGIETDVHRRWVTGAGADLLQGFGIHRPMSAAAVAGHLARNGLVRSVLRPGVAARGGV